MLNEKGSIFVRCDYNGNMYVRLLLNQIFGEENFRNEIVVKRTRTLKGEYKQFSTATDTVFLYTKLKELMFFKGFRKIKPENEWGWVEMHLPGSRKDESLLYRNIFGKRIKSPNGRRWALSQKGFDNAIEQGLVKMDEKNNFPKFLTKWETIGSNWTDIMGYSKTQNFTTENSEILLKRVIESTSQEKDLIMDFFLGSGTTTAVAHKLGRKWVGVEMGEHFNDVVLTRMKKVLAGDKSGVSKTTNWKGGGFFKYYNLEQYEQTLKKTVYKPSHPFAVFSDKTIYQQYIFLKDLKMLDAMEIDKENNKVKVDFSKIYKNVDIAETLSNLTGKAIKKIEKNAVVFEDGEGIEFDNVEFNKIKRLVWW